MIAERANLWIDPRPVASTRRAIPCARAAAARGLGVLD
jgi:hypothetical protein